MYCFIIGHEIPICNDLHCPVRPCTDKRAVDFLRESTDLTLDDAKKEHRYILRGILNGKIVFNVSDLKVNVHCSDMKWYIEVTEIYDRNSVDKSNP